MLKMKKTSRKASSKKEGFVEKQLETLKNVYKRFYTPPKYEGGFAFPRRD